VPPFRLTILHTNDLHGRVDALPRIATLARVERARAEAEGRCVLLVDGGDSEDETLLESAATHGAAVMRMLRAVGYDLAVVGNAVLARYGPAALAAEAEAAGFPILAANVRWPDGRLVTGVTDRVIFDLGGFKLGMTGATADYAGPPWNGLYRLFGLGVTDPAAEIAMQIDRLREAGAEAVLLLSHLGYGDPPYHGDLQLAEQTPGLAAIIGGHSHTTLATPTVVNGTVIAQAGHYGRFLGRLDLDLDPATGRVLAHAGRLIPVTDATPAAPDIAAAIEAIRQDTAAWLDQPIGALAQSLDLADDRECGMGDWVADLLRAYWRADVGLIFSGLLRRELPAGPITRRMRLEACPTGANPMWAWLSGAQLQAILDHTLDPAFYTARPKPFRGRPLGILQVSGLTARIDPAAPPGQRVTAIHVGGAPLDPARRYKVAATDAELDNNALNAAMGLTAADRTTDVAVILGDLLDAALHDGSPVHVEAGDRLTSLYVAA